MQGGVGSKLKVGAQTAARS